MRNVLIGLGLAAALLTPFLVGIAGSGDQQPVEELHVNQSPNTANAAADYQKPSEEELKKRLTPLEYEVTQKEGTEPPFKNAYWDEHREGIYWLMQLTEHFERSCWLNPEPPSYWTGNTIEYVSQVFSMFPLTVDGLGEAVAHLTKGKRGRRAA